LNNKIIKEDKVRCLKCVGEVKISDLGVKCTNCGQEFLILNGELKAIGTEKDEEVPILPSVECCPRCGNEEIVEAEIIARGSKSYRVYRCECGAKVWELLVDKQEHTKYCKEIAEKLLATKGIIT